MPTSTWTRVLFQAIDDAVFVHDQDGKILDANPAACRRLGYTLEELLCLNTRDIDAPEFAAGFQERLQTQLQTGRMRCEGIHRAKDGKRIHVDINTSEIQIDGKPAVLAVMRDITQRKQTEEALGKQRELLQSILDHMSDAIVVADSQGAIVLFNPAAEHIFGPSLLQGNFSIYQSDGTTRLPEFPIARCVRGEAFDNCEYMVRHQEAPSGLWISVAGRPLRDQATVKGGVLVCRDTTTTRRQEKRLQAQYEIGRVIASNREAAPAAEAILGLLCEALAFETGLLWHVEPGHDGLRCLMDWRHPLLPAEAFRAQSRHMPFGAEGDLVADVWRSGQTGRATATDSRWATTPRWHAARQAGLQGVIAVPIRSGAQTIGVLEFWSQRIDDEPDDEASPDSMLQAMASQIGQFLDRLRVERDLHNSRAMYESLVQSLPQNIFRKDRRSRVTFGNQRYCASLKRSLAELLGKTDFDLFPADLAAKYVADDQHILSTGETLDTIEEHRLPDESRLFVHVVKTPVLDANDEIVGVQGIFWDVTQEVLAQRAVTNSEKRYRQLTEATMDGIVVVDNDGSIVLFNPAAERMFAYQAAEVLGGPVHLLIPDEFKDLPRTGVLGYLQARTASLLGQAREVKGKRKDGSDFPVEIVLSLLTDPGSTGHHDQPGAQILVAIRDLTERNKMRDFVMQNEKLASIGLLSAGVAHEINNPLAFVANNLVVLERDSQGLLELLAAYAPVHDKLEPDDATRVQAIAERIDFAYIKDNLARILARSRDGLERVNRIVHSLRGMARTEAPKRQITRIPDLVNSSLDILHGKFKRLGVTVSQSHDAQPVVACVPTQISQVVLNLLVNAFQAIEATHRPDGSIDIRTRRAGGQFTLEIQDNGTGIAPDHLSRMFDPFFTTKDVGEGTGLGLSISHHIIAAHGGRIEVESTLGVGTTFRIYLPMTKPQ